MEIKNLAFSSRNNPRSMKNKLLNVSAKNGELGRINLFILRSTREILRNYINYLLAENYRLHVTNCFAMLNSKFIVQFRA